jgi:hypothetical protein
MVRNLWASCEQSCASIKLTKYGQKFVSKLGAIPCLHKLYISCCSRLRKGRGRLGTIYWHTLMKKSKIWSNSKGLWSFRLLGVQIVCTHNNWIQPGPELVTIFHFFFFFSKTCILILFAGLVVYTKNLVMIPIPVFWVWKSELVLADPVLTNWNQNNDPKQVSAQHWLIIGQHK